MKVNPKIDRITAALGRTRGLYGAWAQRHGIKQHQLTVYYVLHVEGPIAQKRICEKYSLPKQTVNNIINQLKAEGEITLDNDSADKREKRVRLTQKGLERSEAIIGPLLAMEEATATHMGGKRIDQLMAGLDTYADIFSAEFERYEQEK
jgi:DNA-binding MarR family transcriptional regulator